MLLSLLAALTVAAPLRQEPGPPAPRDPYPIFVWRRGGPPPTPAWADALRALGIRGTNVQGAEEPDVATDLGLAFYADHLVRRGVFHRDADDPRWVAMRTAFLANRSVEALVREPSLDDPEVLRAIAEEASSRASRAAAAGARFLSVADEPSFTVGASPLDVDRSPHALRAFRRRLASRFPDGSSLARAWGAEPSPPEEAEHWTTDRILAREWRHAAPWNFAPWAAAREHADASFAEALAGAIGAARAAAPGVPVGFLGGGAPAAFGGHDWRRLLAAGPEVLEVYDLGAARDVVRTLAPEILLVDTAFFSDASERHPATLAPARMSWLFARGGRATIVWANDALFEPGPGAPRPTKAARALGARGTALRRLAERTDGARAEHDSLGIVLSQPSLRASWLLDARGDGARWPLRLTSYEHERSTALASLEAWFLLAEDRSLSPVAIDAEALEDPAAELPSVVVLPRCLALSENAASRLRRHVESGGTLVSEGRPALFDASLRGGGPIGALDDLFGTAPLAFAGFADADCSPGPAAGRTAEGLVVLESELRDRAGARVRLRRSADGRAVLLNLSTVSHRDDRLQPATAPGAAAAAALREAVGATLDRGRTGSRVHASSESGLPLSIHRLRRGEDRWLLVTANVRRSPAAAIRTGDVRSGKVSEEVSATVSVALVVEGASALVRIDGEEEEILPPDRAGAFRFALDPLHLAAFRVEASR